MSNLGNAFSAFATFVLAVTGISYFIESRAQDVERGCMVIIDGWIRWGWILHGGKPQYRYFWVRLPSYQWQRNFVSLEFCWHQAVLAWASDPHAPGWRTIYVPESPQKK